MYKEDMDKILVGSYAFFNGYKDFQGTDYDYVKIVNHPIGFNFVRQTKAINCLFEWKRMKPQEYIDYALTKGPAIQLGKFLVKEFVDEIGFTIEDLKQLQPLVDRLDKKHQYEKVIYDSYLENNDFTLTDEQLEKAYESYKQSKTEVTNG